jgi:hypothetical protein
MRIYRDCCPSSAETRARGNSTRIPVVDIEANLSLQAAAKRYGPESAERKAIEAAWEVVRVPKREPATAQTSGGT